MGPRALSVPFAPPAPTSHTPKSTLAPRVGGFAFAQPLSTAPDIAWHGPSFQQQQQQPHPPPLVCSAATFPHFPGPQTLLRRVGPLGGGCFRVVHLKDDGSVPRAAVERRPRSGLHPRAPQDKTKAHGSERQWLCTSTDACVLSAPLQCVCGNRPAPHKPTAPGAAAYHTQRGTVMPRTPHILCTSGGGGGGGGIPLTPQDRHAALHDRLCVSDVRSAFGGQQVKHSVPRNDPLAGLQFAVHSPQMVALEPHYEHEGGGEEGPTSGWECVACAGGGEGAGGAQGAQGVAWGVGWYRSTHPMGPLEPPPHAPRTPCTSFRRAVLKNPNYFLVQASPQGPPTASRQVPSANHHQPPTANRRQAPPIVQSCCCGLVSWPCLGHEAASIPVNVRFCWRYEPLSFFLPLRTALPPPATTPLYPPVRDVAPGAWGPEEALGVRRVEEGGWHHNGTGAGRTQKDVIPHEQQLLERGPVELSAQLPHRHLPVDDLVALPNVLKGGADDPCATHKCAAGGPPPGATAPAPGVLRPAPGRAGSSPGSGARRLQHVPVGGKGGNAMKAECTRRYEVRPSATTRFGDGSTTANSFVLCTNGNLPCIWCTNLLC